VRKASDDQLILYYQMIALLSESAALAVSCFLFNLDLSFNF